MSAYQEELQFALSLADESRRIVLSHYGSQLKIEWKGDASPVTKADKEAEEALRKRIAKTTPGYGVIGEEFGHEPGSTDTSACQCCRTCLLRRKQESGTTKQRLGTGWSRQPAHRGKSSNG
jgi:3'-phosphoadenosine 5'-phosphosulfate (PAPS) 3'-phosphatase